MTKIVVHYLDGDEFREEVIKCQERGRVSERLGEMFRKLCHRNSGSYIYMDEDDRQDCIANAVLQCVRSYDKYNPETTDNAFAYFTRVAINGLRAGWNKMHRHKSREYRLDQIFKEE